MVGLEGNLEALEEKKLDQDVFQDFLTTFGKWQDKVVRQAITRRSMGTSSGIEQGQRELLFSCPDFQIHPDFCKNTGYFS